MKLRHNWALQELVEIWSEQRDAVYKFAKDAAMTQQEDQTQGRPKKRRKVEQAAAVVQKSGLEERRNTRSQSRRGASQTDGPPSQSMRSVPSTQEEMQDSDAGSLYSETSPQEPHPASATTEPNDGLVGCPNCTRRMKESAINTHLDKCLSGLPTTPTPPPASHTNNNHAPSPTRTGTIAYTTTKPTSSAHPQRLPTINYSLLNETTLRRKLRDLGIPNIGNKETMRKRHLEWMNLWNANCDSLQPVSKQKLLKELDTWERNLGRDERQRQTVASSGGGSGVMEKEFDREGYMKREKDDFADLIQRARESRKAKASAAAAKDAANDERFPNGAAQTPSTTSEAAGQHASDVLMGNTAVQNDSDPHQQQHHAQTTETLVPGTPPHEPSSTMSNGVDQSHEAHQPSAASTYHGPHPQHQGCAQADASLPSNATDMHRYQNNEKM